MNIKKLIQILPFNRLLLYIIVLGFIPASIAFLHFYQQKKEWDKIDEKIRSIHGMSEARVRKQYQNIIVRNAYSEADQFYLENQLESLFFLKKEREALEHLFHSPTFTGNEAAEKRYALITSQANRFAFMQGSPQSGEGIHESLCALSHPVEIDTNDLKEILNRIEGNRKGKPQFIIIDFKLNKKTHTHGNEVYELNLKFKKREFFH
jgi:hypothetical protein